MRYYRPFFFICFLALGLCFSNSACYKYYSVNPTAAPTATTTPNVITYAGSGSPGSSNGTGTAASFNAPEGVAVDSSGNVYVADTQNDAIRKIGPGGVVSTFAGQVGVSGYIDGTGTTAMFNQPLGIAVDPSGNVYVADTNNDLIRMITPAGVVTTLAGQAGVTGTANGTGTAATFNSPDGIALDSSGNIYVADRFNNLIREIAPGGVVSLFAGRVGYSGSQNGPSSFATFFDPWGIAVDVSGNVYVGDWGDGYVRKISGGIVTTFTLFQVPGGLYSPAGFTMDHSGNIYAGDWYSPYGGNFVAEITSAGTVSVLTGQVGITGAANGPLASASFFNPAGVAVDSSGDVFVADEGNNLIREILP